MQPRGRAWDRGKSVLPLIQAARLAQQAPSAPSGFRGFLCTLLATTLLTSVLLYYLFADLALNSPFWRRFEVYFQGPGLTLVGGGTSA